MQTSSTCPSCHGSGVSITKKPRDADHMGMVRKDEVVEIDIPAGVEDGVQLVMRGNGNGAQRNGKNIHHDLYVSFTDAALGASAEVPLLNGKAKIKIEPGTQSGKLVRLRGKGLPSMDSYGNGDLLVNINVWTPQELTKDERKALEGLRDSINFNPDPNHDERGFFDKVRDLFS